MGRLSSADITHLAISAEKPQSFQKWEILR